jgi:hypothetical protein
VLGNAAEQGVAQGRAASGAEGDQIGGEAAAQLGPRRTARPASSDDSVATSTARGGAAATGVTPGSGDRLLRVSGDREPVRPAH